MSYLSELTWQDGKFPDDYGRWAPCVKCPAGRVVMMFKPIFTDTESRILTKVACDHCGEEYEPGPPQAIPPVNV